MGEPLEIKLTCRQGDAKIHAIGRVARITKEVVIVDILKYGRKRFHTMTGTESNSSGWEIDDDQMHLIQENL